MKTNKEPITSFTRGRFCSLEVLFCCQPIPLGQAYICGDSSQLNKAANDTYQNQTQQKLDETEEVAANSSFWLKRCEQNEEWEDQLAGEDKAAYSLASSINTGHGTV